MLTDLIIKAENTAGLITPSETIELLNHIRTQSEKLSMVRTELNKAITDKDIPPTLKPWLKYLLTLAS